MMRLIINKILKYSIRIASKLIHKLGCDSRNLGPPLAQVTSLDLQQEQDTKLTIHHIRSSENIQRKVPNTINDEIHSKFYRDLSRQSPEYYVAEIGDGRTVGSEGVVLTSNDYLLQDLAPVIGTSQQTLREMYVLQLPKLTVLSGSAGLVAGSGGSGYFHWLYDVFPKIILLNQVNSKLDHYIVGNYDKSFVRQSLAAYGISPEKIVSAHETSHFEVDSLFATSPTCFTGNPPAWIIQFLRNTFLGKSDIYTGKRQRRLYISRKDALSRYVVNENAVEELLAEYGFETVLLSNRSIKEQVHLFNQAETIIAPHGAGLSNLAFCNPGTRVIELFSPDYVNVCYWAICNLAHLIYFYLIGINHVSKESKIPNFSQSIYIDLEQLRETLQLSGL